MTSVCGQLSVARYILINYPIESWKKLCILKPRYIMTDISAMACCCTEHVVVFIDKSSEINFMELKVNDGETISPFVRLTKIVRRFFQLKTMVSPGRDNLFCVLAENEYGTVEHTGSKGLVEVDVALSHLKNIDSDQGDRYGEALKLNEIVSRCLEIAPPFPPPVDNAVCGVPPFVVRLILIISRSAGEIILELDRAMQEALINPYLFVDSLYIHEVPSQENSVTANFEKLCALNVNKKGWNLECGPNVVHWSDCMAQLLAHPLIRGRPLKLSTFDDADPK